MKVFTELTPECDITAQMYAAGYEKKEIAVLKHRAVSTINNQLQTAFLILGVRNGRELALKLAERISGIRLTLDFSPAMRSFVACVLLIILCVDSHLDMKRQQIRTRSNANVELIARVRVRIRGRMPLLYGTTRLAITENNKSGRERSCQRICDLQGSGH